MKYFIYKIFKNDDINEFYIGSTNNISSRKSAHRKNVNNRVGKRYWCKLYHYIRLNGNWSNFSIEVLENGVCDNARDMRVKEQEFIDKLKPTLNTIKACFHINNATHVPVEEKPI